MTRGNEFWALIPDLIRIGHDIDPILCMHWQPPTPEQVPPELQKYRVDQNAAFANKLLALCTPALRAKLLAQRSYGVNNVFSPTLLIFILLFFPLVFFRKEFKL